MKLKTKLIPLTGLAAIGATVAPLAMTSCGTKTSDMIDLANWYKPSIAKHAHDTLTLTEGKEVYFGKQGDWKTDTSIIKEDMLWSQSMKLNSFNSSKGAERKASAYAFLAAKEEGVTDDVVLTAEFFNEMNVGEAPVQQLVKSYKESIDAVSWGVTWDDNGKEYPTLSYTLSYDIEYVAGTSQTEAQLVDRAGEELKELVQKSENTNTNSLGTDTTKKEDTSTKEAEEREIKSKEIQNLTTNMNDHYVGKTIVTNVPVDLYYFGDMWEIRPNYELIEKQLDGGVIYKTPFNIMDEYDLSHTYKSDTVSTTSTSHKFNIFTNTDKSAIIAWLRPIDCPLAFKSYYMFSVNCSTPSPTPSI